MHSGQCLWEELGAGWECQEGNRGGGAWLLRISGCEVGIGGGD